MLVIWELKVFWAVEDVALVAFEIAVDQFVLDWIDADQVGESEGQRIYFPVGVDEEEIPAFIMQKSEHGDVFIGEVAFDEQLQVFVCQKHVA